MSCEQSFQVSELLDGELAPAEAPAVVDHLLRCPECAAFFRRGRALDAALLLGLVEAEGATLAPAPPEVWRDIRAAAGRQLVTAETPPPRRRLPAWALPVAATVLLAIGVLAGWQLAVSRLRAGAPAGAASAVPGVTFASFAPPGEMDEQRFVALARELLAADSRYRDAMTGVLAVARSEEPREGSTAESAWRDEELRGLSRTRLVIR
jgi:anti-sigma factor RsiW